MTNLTKTEFYIISFWRQCFLGKRISNGKIPPTFITKYNIHFSYRSLIYAMLLNVKDFMGLI